MEVSQMNKTAILSFIINEVALKCRNVSSNMRKRIHWMLKYMEIVMVEYDVRVLVLNGWIRVGKRGVWISKVEEMKKGISNYILRTQEHLDKLITLNNEVRCHRLLFNPTPVIEAESIESLVINPDKYEIYSKCSFNKVKCLELCKLSIDQIKFILTRCKRINKLDIYNCSLQKLDLTQCRIKRFLLMYISFKEPIYLPKEIDQLTLLNCESPNLIKAQKVSRIDFRSDKDGPKENVELIKRLKGVKVANIYNSLEKCLPSLPSTIRKIDGSYHKEDNLKGIISQFPNLIEVTVAFPFQPIDKSKVRAIQPILQETQEKFSLRPRKIKVNSDNALKLNSHPELFEKVEWVSIESDAFNYDVVPSEIKKIQIGNEVDLESVTLNRLEKERG